jgi:predicted O-methyltransferase YrrM
MLEKLGTSQATTISRPNRPVVAEIDRLLKKNVSPIFAEIGVGVGATTLAVAKILDNVGEIHIFDFEQSVSELKSDLASLGFNNVVAYGNTEKYWDSYHWNFAKLLSDGANEIFDVIYIDGAHTYLHDALAFFMCDRLLKVGGAMIFDDWNWSFSQSRWMKGVRDNFMTEEQINNQQIGYLLNTLVKNHIGYEEALQNEVFRKIASTTKPTSVS